MLKVLVVVLWSAAIVGLVAYGDSVTVTYLGHSCFTIQAADGPTIMIDPYASYVPYPALPQPADIVLMTHAHVDHCPPSYGEIDRVTGAPTEVIPWNSQGRVQEGDRSIADVLVHVVEASHVTATGGGAGYVGLFAFDVGGIRFAHLGDVGRILTSSQTTALGSVDVLFLPVGGAYTINAAEALTVVAQLPTVKIVFPMHYFVDGITPWPAMAPLSEFSRVADILYEVVDQGASQVTLDSGSLPETVEIWVLEYFGQN